MRHRGALQRAGQWGPARLEMGEGAADLLRGFPALGNGLGYRLLHGLHAAVQGGQERGQGAVGVHRDTLPGIVPRPAGPGMTDFPAFV